MPMKTENQEAMLSCLGKFLCRLIFSGYFTFKNNFESIFTFSNKICRNLYISKLHVYVYMIYTVYPPVYLHIVKININ